MSSEISWLALIATLTKIFIDQSPVTSWQSPIILNRKTNKQKSIFCLYSRTVKFAGMFLGKHVMKKVPAFRAAVLRTHMPLFQPYRCCISLRPPEKHRVPTSEEKTMALLPNKARCPGLIRNSNLLTRALFILVLTAPDFNSLFGCFYYYNREGCLLIFLLYDCLYTQRLPTPN